jgi:hypothetical protein
MYHVYQASSGGVLKAIILQNPANAADVDRAIASIESVPVGSINWYGVDANSEDDAIAQAVRSGYRYRSPIEMQDKFNRLSKFLES